MKGVWIMDINSLFDDPEMFDDMDDEFENRLVDVDDLLQDEIESLTRFDNVINFKEMEWW